MTLTAERLRELLDYDPETGVFTWLRPGPGKLKAGTRAGCVVHAKVGDYWIIRPTRQYPLTHAHRLAVLWMTGQWPTKQVDHINGNGLDNRWANLREADNAENCWNQESRPGRSGYRGVWATPAGSFVAYISHRRQRICLGRFSTAEDAARAWDHAAMERRGQFARLNCPAGVAA